MPAATYAGRRQSALIAINTRWANCPDRAAATRPGLDAFLAKFERQVDPDGVLPAEERHRRAKFARTAHMRQLALASSKKRRAAAGGS
jgi:hypothetical protein